MLWYTVEISGAQIFRLHLGHFEHRHYLNTPYGAQHFNTRHAHFTACSHCKNYAMNACVHENRDECARNALCMPFAVISLLSRVPEKKITRMQNMDRKISQNQMQFCYVRTHKHTHPTNTYKLNGITAVPYTLSFFQLNYNFSCQISLSSFPVNVNPVNVNRNSSSSSINIEYHISHARWSLHPQPAGFSVAAYDKHMFIYVRVCSYVCNYLYICRCST